ncbi:MAG: T9SS type A sorting domain-containing protein [Bacteroidales bacterium]|nr:T9SS type A sorting domain-containing protein [Bacteroidales bacterium]
MRTISNIKIPLLALMAFCCCSPLRAQQHVNALFVGNSYTEVNNLPGMVQQIAASMGDQLTWQSNTPGGCTFSQHCGNRSMELICSGGWDIVVLQEQSQYPSFPQWQVEAEVFPYAERLVNETYAHNPCCEPMFYMTWGRKNGDAGNAVEFPVLGTYEGMDSMLCERYTYMAQQNDASLCPVGRVWRYLRENHDDIELYQSDGSHPSVAGTYAAACAFYVMFFHRDPDSIAFDASLPQATARTIRSAVHGVVYENLAQWQRPRPQAAFEVEMVNDSTALFSSATLYADRQAWHFGDGSDTILPVEQTTVNHTYATTGTYTAMLIASRHCMTDTFSVNISVVLDTSVGIIEFQTSNSEIRVSPNPARDRLTVTLPSATVPATVMLIGLDGRHISVDEVHYSPFEINVGNLPAGEYIVQLNNPTGILSRRVVILR